MEGPWSLFAAFGPWHTQSVRLTKGIARLPMDSVTGSPCARRSLIGTTWLPWNVKGPISVMVSMPFKNSCGMCMGPRCPRLHCIRLRHCRLRPSYPRLRPRRVHRAHDSIKHHRHRWEGLIPTPICRPSSRRVPYYLFSAHTLPSCRISAHKVIPLPANLRPGRLEGDGGIILLVRLRPGCIDESLRRLRPLLRRVRPSAPKPHPRKKTTEACRKIPLFRLRPSHRQPG